uniref:Uncharacterized protein n=1 Tax=Anguilla anguilla TaxID=7936 RepID=A0A0E9UA70_ANGAN
MPGRSSSPRLNQGCKDITLMSCNHVSVDTDLMSVSTSN